MASYDEIVDNVSNAIPELTNTSSASVFRRIIYAFAAVTENMQTEMTNTSKTIASYVQNNAYGSTQYYVKAALAFQYGDTLQYDENYRPYYQTIDPSKQIVKQAAVQVITNNTTIDGEFYTLQSLILKVASISETGQLAPLTKVQMEAFQAYIQNYAIPGIPLSVPDKTDPDLIRLSEIVCTYSTQYDKNALADQVTAAMNRFRDTITFNSIFYINHLEAYIKENVLGVIDFYIGSASVQTPDGWKAAENGQITLASGYFNYEENTNIEYVPGN